MSIHIYESFENVTGTKSDYERLITAVKFFSRDSLLWNCGAVNYGVHAWQANRLLSSEFDVDVQAALHRYFAPRLAVRLHAAGFFLQPRVVFHRRQLLALQKLAILHSNHSGRNIDAEPYRFGSLLLMVNDHLHSPDLAFPATLTTDLEFAAFIAEFLPITEVGSEELGISLARTLLMLGPLTEKRKGKKRHYDALGRFELHSGVDRRSFRAFLFATQAYLNSLTFRRVLAEPGNLYINHHRFANTALAHSQVAKLFRHLSASGDQIATDINTRDFSLNDFTGIRKFPLVERWMNTGLVSQWCGYLALDPIYLWDKLLTAPYWLSSNAHGDNFRSFWGDLFEDYCNQLMTEATPLYKGNLRLTDDRQLCDGLLLEGNSLIVFEYKGVMLSAEAKYGGDARKLRDAIYRNFVKTERGQKKGVQQLDDAIYGLFGPERRIEQLFPQWRAIEKVIPCIVTLDSIGGAVGVSPMLQLYSRNDRLSVHKMPIFCMPISELERRAPFVGSTGLASMLTNWYEVNPSLGTPLNQIETKFGSWSELPILKVLDSLNADASVLFPGEDFS